MSLRRRLKALEGRWPRSRLRPEDCPSQFITALISPGDPLPEPAGEPCPTCGHAHVLVVEEVVVGEPAEGGA